MRNSSEILIVGGGLAGSCLALALARHGLGNCLIDARPQDMLSDRNFDGRSYALSLSSQRLLDAIGIWARVSDQVEPILGIKASDGRAGEGPSPWVLHFDHAEIEEGPMGYMIEDRYLRRAFATAIGEETGITHLTGRRVTGQSVADGGASILLEDGQELTGTLLVGCDGRQSHVAARAGIRRTGWGYDQTALVSAIAHEHPHQGIAHQFFMPSGPLAILPLPGNRSSIVWSETTERAAEIQALDDEGYLDALRPAFGDFLGQVSLTGHRFAYPLDLTLAQSIVAPRLALVGDAAHGVHPIAGQGLNIGLRDVGTLAEVLVSARRRGEDVASGSVLARYADWRKVDTATLACATDGFNRLFSNDNPAIRPLRDLGLGIVNSIPVLRRSLIREAAGLTGDLPRLMQGLPI